MSQKITLSRDYRMGGTSAASLLTWSQIQDIFVGEWVEMVDVEWQPNSVMPRRARVRCAAPDRGALLKLSSNFKASGEDSSDSVIVFIGQVRPMVTRSAYTAVL